MFRNSPKTLNNKENFKKELTKLKQEEAELDAQITNLQSRNDGNKSTKEHRMNALHEYNDIKDATQVVLGALATLEGVTVTQIHNRFELPLHDKDG